MEEKKLWEGVSSQWINFGYYIVCVLLLPVFGIGLFMFIWRYLTTKFKKFEITNERIIEHKGVLSRTTDELELYRVKDIKLHQPFFLRLFKLSNIVLSTTDRSSSILIIKGIENGQDLRNILRKSVEERRDKKKVREIDFE